MIIAASVHTKRLLCGVQWCQQNEMHMHMFLCFTKRRWRLTKSAPLLFPEK